MESNAKKKTMADLFGAPISTYSRRQMIADGFQADANVGDLAEVTRQHYRLPCFIGGGLWAVIQKACANKRWANDVRGVWHDICWMGSLVVRRARNASGPLYFKVIIRGAGRKSVYVLAAEIGPLDIDDPAPALTFMLPEER